MKSEGHGAIPGHRVLFALLVSLSFALLGWLLGRRHEPWEDEVNTWVMTRVLPDWRSILVHLKYEGHPPLWYLALKSWTAVFPSLPAMKILHLCFSTGTVFLISLLAPFPRVPKVLLSVSYLLAYEYSIICRNYAMGVFLLVAATAWYLFFRPPAAESAPNRFEITIGSGIPLGMFLLGAAGTSVHALFLAAALLTFIMLDSTGWGRRLIPANLLFGLVVSLGIIGIGLHLVPPDDASFAPGWHTSLEPDRLRCTLGTLSRALFPIPQWESFFWGTSALDPFDPDGWVHAFLGPLLLVFFLASFRKTPLVSIFLAMGNLLLWSLFYGKYLGYLRHWGFHGICLLLALWLEAGTGRDSPALNPGYVNTGFFCRWRGPLLGGILFCQVLGFAVASFLDWNLPFSQSVRTAEFLREHVRSGVPLAGDDPFQMVGVAGQLEVPYYSPRLDRTWRFWILRDDCFRKVTLEETLGRWNTWAAAQATAPFLVCNYLLSENLEKTFHLQKVGEFRGAIMVDEQYMVYRRIQDPR